MATQAFRRFPELPMELQLQIWKIAFDFEDPYANRDDPDNYYTTREIIEKYSWKRQRINCGLVLTTSYPNENSEPPTYVTVGFDLKDAAWWNKGHKVGTSIMRVCRISRVVALQRWYNIVLCMPDWYNDQIDQKLILRILGGLVKEWKAKVYGSDASLADPPISSQLLELPNASTIYRFPTH